MGPSHGSMLACIKLGNSRSDNSVGMLEALAKSQTTVLPERERAARIDPLLDHAKALSDPRLEETSRDAIFANSLLKVFRSMAVAHTISRVSLAVKTRLASD